MYFSEMWLLSGRFTLTLITEPNSEHKARQGAVASNYLHITFVRVSGHSGTIDNSKADKLARKGSPGGDRSGVLLPSSVLTIVSIALVRV